MSQPLIDDATVLTYISSFIPEGCVWGGDVETTRVRKWGGGVT